MAEFDDDLKTALRNIAADSRSGPGLLNGPAVRHLADRRQSRQRALAAAAVVVLLLVGGGLALDRTSSSRSLPASPSTPTPTPTATHGGAPTVVPASAMLKATDLVGSIIGLNPPYPTSVRTASRKQADWPCAPAESDGAATRTATFRTGSGDTATWIDQSATQFADDASATTTGESIVHELIRCASTTDGVTVVSTASETGVGDAQSGIVTMTIPGNPNAHAVHKVWFEIARTGHLVTWVGFEFYTQDDWPAQDIALRRAVTHLCSLGGGACVKEPVVRQTTYTALPAVNGFTLTPAALAGAIGDHWMANSDVTLAPPYPCTDSVTGLTKTVTGEVTRSWESDLVDTYGKKIVRSNLEVGEDIRPLASPAAALAVVQAITQSFDQCGEVPTRIVSGSGGRAWQQLAKGPGQRWWVARSKGSKLVTMELRVNGTAKPFTDAQVNALINAALARLP